MANITVSSLSNALKKYWPQSDLKSHLYTNRPLIGMLRKDEKAGGDEIWLPIRTAPGSGRSATFSDAQGNKGPATYARFELTLVTDYATFSINGQAIRKARLDPWKTIRQIASDGDAVRTALENSVAHALYSNGGGAIGKIVSGGGTTTLTLTDDGDTNMIAFEEGLNVDCSNTDGTSGAVDGDPVVISATNPVARTITKTGGNWNASGNYSDDDYIFAEGDFGAKASGLAAWVPPSDPSSTSFFGVDRTANILKLGGYRRTLDTSKDGDLHRGFINVSADLHQFGASPDSLFMNPIDWAYLDHEIEGKTTYEKMTSRDQGGPFSTVGYETIRIMGAAGPINVYADPWCPKKRAYMLTLDECCLFSLGNVVGWLNEDDVGNILREATTDSYEGRFGGYFQLGVEMPGHQATIDTSAMLPY